MPTRTPKVFEPRDKHNAASVLVVILVLTISASLGWEAVAWFEGRRETTVGSSATTLAVCIVLLALFTVVHRAAGRVPALLWASMPVLALVGTVLVAVTSITASAGAQFPLVSVVAFAASQWNRAFAWTVTALAIAADGWIVFSLLQPSEAIRDLMVAASVLTVITVVLQATNDRQDRLISKLDELATTDPLTGLSTRRVLDAAMELALAGVRAGDRHPHVGLALVDLDRFKQINDHYGHPVGDAALVQLARTVLAAKGPTDVVVRLGGDELAVLKRGDATAVAQTAEAILHGVRTATVPEAPGLQMTVSIGYAMADDDRSPESLYRAADAALYMAKTAGRDRVHGPGIAELATET
jgi:diguanylate cyclase (GGDEF)-like protein